MGVLGNDAPELDIWDVQDSISTKFGTVSGQRLSQAIKHHSGMLPSVVNVSQNKLESGNIELIFGLSDGGSIVVMLDLEDSFRKIIRGNFH